MKSMSYERFNEYRQENPNWTELEFACGSDYSGGVVERANYQYFLEQFAEHEDVIRLSGMFFSYGIGYNKESTDSDLIDAVNALEYYPVADDELLYEVQNDWENDAWDNFIESDLLTRLKRNPAFETLLDNGFDNPEFRSNLKELFYSSIDQSNCHWEYHGDSAWINADKVYDSIEYSSILELFGL